MVDHFPPYQALLEDLGRMAQGLDRLYAEQLNCRAGCDHCCQQQLSVFEVEAAAVRQALKQLSPELQHTLKQQAEAALAGQRQGCALLLDQQCSIYAQRPVICRSHGYPVRFEGEIEGELFLDVCPLNFTTEGALEQIELEQTVPLDPLNLRLAAINYVYCRNQLADVERSEQRYTLAELALQSQT